MIYEVNLKKRCIATARDLVTLTKCRASICGFSCDISRCFIVWKMSFKMGRNVFVPIFTLLFLFAGLYSVSATSSPARIMYGFLSHAFSMMIKWVQSLRFTLNLGVLRRPVVKFERGFRVETVFDGSKLGIEPYSVEVLPDGDLLILDCANSNLYKISSPLSLYDRPRLISGSANGFPGFMDGTLKEAMMNHPKGLTVDGRGNIYIADTANMAIRKMSNAGVTTIAGGEHGRGGVYADGPGNDAKFSNDFDVVYVGSSCSLIVIDRGHKAIRNIQLSFDDCVHHFRSRFKNGFALLVAAGFFGYMLALLQFRIGRFTSSSAHQSPLKPSGDEQGKQGGKNVGQVIPMLKKKPVNQHNRGDYQHQEFEFYSETEPLLESFSIPNKDDPPPVETQTPTPQKTGSLVSNEAMFSEWKGQEV